MFKFCFIVKTLILLLQNNPDWRFLWLIRKKYIDLARQLQYVIQEEEQAKIKGILEKQNLQIETFKKEAASTINEEEE